VNPPRPHRSGELKSPTATIRDARPAEPAPTPAPGSAPKNAARKGVRSALPPATRPHRNGARFVAAWLTVTTTGTPRARSLCACGRDRTARGREPVLALITEHTDHRTACPLRTPHTDQEGAAA
jgi:hypothetical protein